jgi:tRNA-splicing endonuclease subunit Sen2
MKTLVLCYVDVPAPDAVLGSDIGATLRGYKVREFVVKRWVANRSRD